MFAISKLNNRAKYILSTVMIIIFSFCFSSFYNEGKIIIPQGNKAFKYSPSGTEYYDVSLKDLVLNGDVYTSTTVDPNITVNFNEPQKIQNIRLSLSVTDEDNETMIQVFFRDSQSGFSEKNSVRTTASSGEYTFRLPEAKEYVGLRLDITNEQGTAVTISSAEFSCGNTDILLGLFPVFITCVLYFSAAFVLFEFNQRGKIGHRKFCLSELLLAVMFTAGVVFVKMYGDGNVYAYIDIGSDTVNSYLPLHAYYSAILREFNVDLWSAEMGFGGSTLSSCVYDPLMICIILLTSVLGRDFLLYGIVIHKIGCVLLSAFFCYKFLCLFSNKYHLCTIAAYLYTFNGFGNIWGQHYHFAAYPVFTIIVFYGVETYLRAGNKKISLFLIIISGLCMASSVYTSYMIYLSAAVYALIRYIYMTDNFRIKPFISKFALLLANVLIGFGMGMWLALPSIEGIMSSGRVGGSGFLSRVKSAVNLNFFEPWWDMPRRMITGPQTKYSFNYYEDQQLFFSILAVVILLQFIFAIHKVYKKPRQMLCVYFSVALSLFAVYNGTISLALNAFAAVGVYRGLYVLFPGAALLVLSVLDNICYKKIFSYQAAAVGGIISAAALLEPGLWADDTGIYPGVKGMMYVGVTLLMVAVAVLIQLYRSKNKQFAIVMLCAVLGINCVAELHITYNRRGVMSKARYEMWRANEKETNILLDCAKNLDDDYYRIDKTYYDFNSFTDSLFENYRGLTLYKSADMSTMMNFYNGYLSDRYNYRRALKIYSGDPNSLVQWSMTGLRYILSKYEPYDTDHFELIAENNEIKLYRLSDSDSFATFYTNAVSYNEFMQLGFAERTKILQGSVVLEDDFVGSPYGITAEEAIAALGERNITNELFPASCLTDAMNEGDQREFFLPENWSDGIEGEIFIEYSFTASEAQYASLSVDSGNGYISVATTSIPASATVSERFTLPRGTKSIQFDFPSEVAIVSINITTTQAPLRPNECNAAIKDNGSDSHLTADVDCNQNGLLFLPVPFHEGWSAYVDGNETEIILANSGFMAVNLTEGQHRIEFVYKNKAFIYGIIISIISLGVAVLFWYLEKLKTTV